MNACHIHNPHQWKKSATDIPFSSGQYGVYQLTWSHPIGQGVYVWATDSHQKWPRDWIMTEGASQCQQKPISVKQSVKPEAKRHCGFRKLQKLLVRRNQNRVQGIRERTRTGSCGARGQRGSRGQGGWEQKHQEKEGEFRKLGNDWEVIYSVRKL